MTEDEIKQIVEDENKNPWKRAIIEGLVVNFLYTKELEAKSRNSTCYTHKARS